MNELNIQLYFKLLHAMLRKGTEPEESLRAREIMLWAAENTSALQRVMKPEERRLVAVAMAHWQTYRDAPSLMSLETLVHKHDQPEAMITLLEGYKEHSVSFQPIDATDVRVVLNDRKEDWEKCHFVNAAHTAALIATQGIDAVKKGDPPRKGVKDAHRYLIERFQDGLVSGGGGVSGGSVADIAPTIISMYNEIEQQANEGKLVIRTGISAIDDTCVGLYRGTLNLVLGFTGQRKSAVSRTIGYNASLDGFRVLFIPLEMSDKEELQFLAMMHATNMKFFEGTENYSITRFQNGKLLAEEKEFLSTTVVPDMQSRIGSRMVIIKPTEKTWSSIRNLIELENFKEPLDLVVIDYLSMMDTAGARDRTAAINDIAIQVKNLSGQLDNGRGGVAIVTPAQGSRGGYEDAQKNDGHWDKDGVYMYSELERSADTIMYCFMPAEMGAQGLIKIGTCKSRRSADVPAQLVNINIATSRVGGEIVQDGGSTVPTSVKDLALAGTY
jgi:archaellum biogenesis ATPase FlaH